MGVRTDTADALRGVGSVLVVDDDEIVATSIARSLASRDVAVTTAGSEADALAQLDRRRFDLVLLDLQFPGDWRRVLLTARATTPPSLVVMVSGRGSIESAVESIRLGASDFVEKPFAYDELRQRIRRAVTAYENGLRPSPPPSSASPSARARRHVVPSTPSYDAWSLADRVASTPACPALLVGESGVGKEILAERIHERSARGSGPFVRVSLAAIAEAIVESELFGSVAGALTDSHG